MACSYAWSSLGYHCLCAASLLCTLRRSAERKRPSLARWPREMNTMLADVRSDGEGGGLLTVPAASASALTALRSLSAQHTRLYAKRVAESKLSAA